MKKAITIAVSVVFVFFVLGIAKDMIVKAGVEKGVFAVTGLRLETGSLNIGILNPLVDIKRIKLFNPKTFKDRTMMDAPEIFVSYDLFSMFKNRIHLKEVRIDLKEFTVVKNDKGIVNLDFLKGAAGGEKGGRKPTEKTSAKTPKIQIDSLSLKIGKVVYKDYSAGTEPTVKEFNLNIDEKYENIDNPYSLVSLIVARALSQTTIAELTNFNIEGLAGTVQKVTGVSTEKAAQTVKTVQETAKKTAGVVADTLKNVFGSGK